ncbi:AraC family transcriptional regulator [Paenibacillus donghaensis]|uniref:HTH araC/xylS-type domain-containing protein n=1 Tax=Paenibacillus donghaensis TaxID=414771 RepID=A0A2Z2KHZ9_9BACL|nr:AraC family transcriptional regulator [Paenibacillus donghaensis]ASA23725.1 hypothetical protein B9T62_24805 [Paenibacillus donghaensis]
MSEVQHIEQHQSYSVDELTNSALADFAVQCVFRSSEITQPYPHVHQGYEWYFCLGGNGRFIAGERVYRMSEGSLVVVKPAVLHTPRPLAGETFQRIVLTIDSDYLQGLYRMHAHLEQQLQRWLPGDGSDSVHTELGTRQLPEVQEILLELERELADQREGYPLAVQSLLLRLFVALIRQAAAAAPVPQEEMRRKQLVEEMLGYITRMYKEPCSIDGMCRHFHLSRSYLQRLFKQETGFSINGYWIACRINRAKELLVQHQSPLIEVAVDSGFQDLSHFCHMFKRVTGMTPGRYRALSRRPDA